jgi:RHS repeat-associated protein
MVLEGILRNVVGQTSKQIRALALCCLLTLALSAGGQIRPLCGPDPACTPDTGSSSYPSAVAARTRPMNARGTSPLIAIARLNGTSGNADSATTTIGSQSYNYVIPILRLPGRPGMDLALNLYYNSRIWDVDTTSNTVTFNADRDSPSYGFRLDFGYVEFTGSEVILTATDGSKNTLSQGTDPAKPYMYYATDGSHTQYNTNTNIATYNNGRTVQYLSFPSNASLLRPVWIKDSNGNYISIAYMQGRDLAIYQISDSLGRVITFNYDSANRLTSLSQLVHPSGSKTYVTFSWGQPYSAGSSWYNFSGLSVNGAPDGAQVNVLTGCTYPNGTQYRFTYGDWGIVNKIELLSSNGVTRSYVSYNYPSASAGALADAPAYTQQTISPDGTTANSSSWTYATTKNAAGAVTSLAITDPNSTTATTNVDATTGLISSVQITDQSNTALRTTAYTWTTIGAAPVSTVIDNIVTTLNDTGQQSKIAYSYDPWGNVTDVNEYDLGLVLKRHTVTSYLTTGDYVTLNLVNLPTEILVKDGSGATVSRTDFTYDGYAANPLSSVTGASDHDDVSYGSSFATRGNLTTLTRYTNAAAGTGALTRTFSYDTLGNLVKAQLDCCNQKTFAFSSATQYSAPDSVVRGPSGGTTYTTSYTYNPDNNQLLTTTDENGQTTQYLYDSMGRVSQVLQPPQNGTQVQVNTAYDDSAASPAITKSSTANSAVSVTTLDGLGHVLQVDNKNSSSIVNTVKYAYDKLWQRTEVSNPFASGDTVINTGFAYDSLGRVTQITPPSGGNTQYKYSGNAVTITDPAGNQRKNVFDAFGRLTEVDEPGGGAPSTIASGTLGINGTLQSSTGTAQSATAGRAELTYSGSLQSKAICSPSGLSCTDSGTISVTVAGVTKSAHYSSATGTDSGQAVRAIASAFHSDTSAPVDAIYFGADESGNIVMDLVARTKGAATNYPLSTSIISDNPTNFTSPSFQVSAPANLHGGQDASNGGTIYDSGTIYVTVGTFTASVPYSQTSNNTASAIASALVAPGPTSLNQSSSPVTATANGSAITLAYKTVGSVGNLAVGLTSSSANPDNPSFYSPGTTLSGGADATPPSFSTPAATVYAYDVSDNLVQVTQGTQTRIRMFDSLGRPTTVTSPESGTVNTYYTDANGNSCSGDPTLPCRVQDARGIVKTITYDSLNRPSGVSYSDNTPSVSYTYDGGGSAAFALDRLTKITEGSNSQTFKYDNFGRIASVDQIIDGTDYPISYTYNLADQLTSIKYPSGRTVTQNLDAVGRLSSIASAGITYLSGLSYNAAGGALAFTMGNNVQAAFSYNDHLQLAALRYFKSGAATDIVNLGYDYGTVNTGQIQAVHYYTSPGVEDTTKSEYFTYDPLARLSGAHTGTVNSTPGTWNMQWNYDQFGNRTAQNLLAGNFSAYQPNFAFDSATNHITNPGYRYDAAGNMLSDSVTVYSYDGANRLTQINNGAAYAYFGATRIKKTVGNTTTIYIYSGNKPVAEYANGSLSKEYIYNQSQLLATIAGAVTTYHHPDHLSIRAQTDASGNTVRTVGHLPFGDAWYETGTTDKWKFATYERDTESGLDYAQARYISSTQGRFMTADVIGGHIGAPQSMNRYSYVSNDPINLLDPLGLDEVTVTCTNGDCVQSAPLQESVEVTPGDDCPATAFSCETVDTIFVGGGTIDPVPVGGSGPPTVNLDANRQKVVCNPKVLKAIEKAWDATILANGGFKGGNSQREAGFTVQPSDLTSNKPIKIQGGVGAESTASLRLTINPGITLATFHTHLNGNGMPSTTENNAKGSTEAGDTLAAKDGMTDVFVISANGLAIAPGTTQDVKTNADSFFVVAGNNLSQWLKALQQFCAQKK